MASADADAQLASLFGDDAPSSSSQGAPARVASDASDSSSDSGSDSDSSSSSGSSSGSDSSSDSGSESGSKKADSGSGSDSEKEDGDAGFSRQKTSKGKIRKPAAKAAGKKMHTGSRLQAAKKRKRAMPENMASRYLDIGAEEADDDEDLGT